MKKFILVIAFLFLVFTPVCQAFSLNGSALRYAGSTKYYPQGNIYANRYRQQNKTYLYSPQQAKYYGYGFRSQMRGYNNRYYNPYRRY